MSDYFTTDELAKFLRIKPRKVYDLISKGNIPHSRVMGKLLFSKIEISNWISGTEKSVSEMKNIPNVLLGSHDPLLELAVKHSKSGIAMSFDGSIQGINRFKLMTLNKKQTLHAMGIAGSLGAGLMAAQEGAMVKRLHSGRAAEAGVLAAELAAKKFTGISNIIEALAKFAKPQTPGRNVESTRRRSIFFLILIDPFLQT